MSERHLSQRDLADEISKRTRAQWTQSKIGKLLTGYTELGVNELAELANAVGISMAETVRDRGMEFYAEATPTELRILAHLKRHPELLQALLVFLRLSAVTQSDTADQKPRRRGRPKHSDVAKRRA